MNLPKAIEILTEDLNRLREDIDPDERDALKLGIEAMKREQLLRYEIPYDREGLLPGETPE